MSLCRPLNGRVRRRVRVAAAAATASAPASLPFRLQEVAPCGGSALPADLASARALRASGRCGRQQVGEEGHFPGWMS